MIDIDDIACQVRENCDISDARHAGLYSICGLALRLRDLYKWENRLPPWEERDSSQILEWIGAREDRWEKLAGQPYRKLTIGGRNYTPFDTRGINIALASGGLFYGAGYAHSLKPTFLLARLEGRQRVNGRDAFTLGQELARDLLTLPALSQDGAVILRREATRLYLWDKISYIRKSGRPALQFALAHCGLANASRDTLRKNLQKITAVQLRTHLYHEIGELEDTVFTRGTWREIIAAFPHSPVELAARAIKDLLADTGLSGPLRHIIDRRDTAALGFFVAFYDGLGKEFFPELFVAFQLFAASGDWRVIQEAAAQGNDNARRHAETMLAVFEEGQCRRDPEWSAREIENRLLGGILGRGSNA